MKIFIDTNIYLRFFDGNSSEYKKLLKSLEELENEILITKQIVDEVSRNKGEVFLSSFNGYINQLNISKVNLPEHLESTSDDDLKKWNKETRELTSKIQEQKSKLKDITSSLLENIIKSDDSVSNSLQKIFDNALVQTDQEFNEAEYRKATGNPPGKKNDPIGDELSWEQLLNNIAGISDIFIVSNDGDFMLEFNKQCYLTPKLYSEIKERNPEINIYCFKKLSQALPAFNEKLEEKLKTLPDEEELKKISKEEDHSTRLIAYEPLRNTNMSCPYCGHDSLFGPFVKPSQYGYYSEQFICNNCKNTIDTGEPVD